ncbi:hypothetical protein JM946_20785 [Steroidobacter sp. S1-65]|uniref:AsnC family protein n=1 Tax=Steroidobacter gossypii TaxID=2805490 RepID=A0ABS1X1T0_9GAMM|nr:hypothetical protein [Steroidobacter gossypii]MBM0107179.1 hypothetical protein [Steroidobacter gossypii]
MATKAKRSKTPAKKKSSSKATSRVRWTSQNDREMKGLIKEGTPARAIASKLKRTEAAVRQRIHKLGLSLRSSKKKAARRK